MSLKATPQPSTKPIDFLEEIANFTFTSKYARYNEKEKRRETWEETVGRLEKMHLKRFSYLSKEDQGEIRWAFDRVREKLVAPSMRSLQFGGKAIEAHESRIYNCSVRHVDSLRSFAEIFYLLLCGSGVGLGLSKRFLDRLPDLVSAEDKSGTIITYVIEDDIEGWADSVEALLMCYFKNTPYTGRKIVFDYSRIRKKGAPLKTGGGKAPGYRGLKQAHDKIKVLLDYIIEEEGHLRLKTIHAYDIIMHAADAVLSGGIRRSATSVVFDLDDDDMMNAKTFFKVDKVRRFVKDEDTGMYHGQVVIKKRAHEVIIDEHSYTEDLKKEGKIRWFHIEPQRARSNNSVMLLRDTVTKEQFQGILAQTRQFGEPGFVFASHRDMLFNPCQPAWATVLTRQGISTIGALKEGDYIWSETGWTKVERKWSTGVKPVYRYRTTAGIFYGTENHRVVSGGVKIEASNADSIDRLSGPSVKEMTLNPQDIMDGIVFGDGSVHAASNDLVHLYIGQDDGDYHTSEVAKYIREYRPGLNAYSWEVITYITAEELPLTFNRVIPERYVNGAPAKVAAFLRGLYTANGSIVADRITLKASSFRVIEQVQLMLSSLGIASYYTTNQPSQVRFSNGEYLCKQSYDLNITRDRKIFASLIGFIQLYKMDKLNAILLRETRASKSPKVTFDVVSAEKVSEEEVFDITVDNATHTYWTGGLNVSNCFEISFIPVTSDGVCGVTFCNLTTQNGHKITTKERFRDATKAATIIGTLQAAYTHFPYLSPAARKLTEAEALLGVSITGLMENPHILLNPEIQREMAALAVQTNAEWAKKIGINPAARITCVKPEGTSSLVLGTSSGIHPHHARRYFRRIQCNRLDNVFRHARKANPHAVEESLYSTTKTDDVITFPLTVPDQAMVKADLTALKHLDIIRSTQQNWVIPGTTPANTKPIAHNVSCTVMVKEDEWQPVIDYLYENRAFFAAVSLLPATGDKLYPQAPMEAVVTEEDEKRWTALVEGWKHIDFKTLAEGDDETQMVAESSCAGGKCELP
jgi:hypothetical protein